MPDESQPLEPEAGGLPFDPLTLLLSLWRRKAWMVASAIASALLGAIAGLTLGEKSYEAETILLHRPEDSRMSEQTPLSLDSYRQLVTLRTNLEETRRRLGLEATLRQIGSSCTVVTELRSSFLTIRTRWNSPDMAAALGDTLSDVFVESERSMRRARMVEAATSLSQHLKTAQDQLAAREAALDEFVADHEVLDPAAALDRRTEELTSVEGLHRETLALRDAADKQLADLQSFKESLKEPPTAGAPGEINADLQDLNQRLGLLQDSIAEDQAYRTNLSQLAERELDLARAKRLAEEGISSQEVVDRAQLAYDRQKLLTEDTPRIAVWRNEADALQLMALRLSAVGPQQQLMKTLVDRGITLQLDKTAHAVKLLYLEGARSDLENEIAQLGPLQRPYEALVQQVTAAEAEVETLAAALLSAQRERTSPSDLFTVVSRAKAPTETLSSSRRPIAMQVAALSLFLCVAVILGLELLDTSIKSARELALKLPCPVLGECPAVEHGSPAAATVDGDGGDRFHVIARRLRRDAQRSGARILVTSPGRSEGRSLVSWGLAACWGRERERVLVVDAHVRPGFEQRPPGAGSAEGERSQPGLEAYLEGATSDSAELVQATEAAGVWTLPCREPLSEPSLLWSQRMNDLLEQLSARFDIIVLDAPPLLPHADAVSLAKWADATVLVVRSNVTRRGTLRQALERLEDWGVPLTGAILNAVSPPFRQRE